MPLGTGRTGLYGPSTTPAFATYSDLSAAVAANGGQSVGAVVNVAGVAETWNSVLSRYCSADENTRVNATISAIRDSYSYESFIELSQGPRNTIKSAFPSASDTPTITGSNTPPPSDADAASQKIMPFGVDTDTELNIHQKELGSQWISGWNKNLRARIVYGISARLAGFLTKVGEEGNQGSDQNIDLGTTWGISSGVMQLDVILDGDVMFFRTSGRFGASFEVHVNEAIVPTTAVGAGISVSANGRTIYMDNDGYVKIKFQSKARRRITIFIDGIHVPVSLFTRTIDSITPVIKPVTWLHFGDSFSQSTISDQSASTITQGMTQWLNLLAGRQCNFIDVALGGTSLADPGQILPSTQAPYTTGKSPSIRKMLLTATNGLDAGVITALLGHNDAPFYSTPLFESELRAFISDCRRMHPNAVIVIFGSNASPAIITNGTASLTETKIRDICRDEGCIFIPLQNVTPPFLRGTGKQGSENGTGNSDRYTGPDGIHPTIDGHRAYGEILARKLISKLSGLPNA